MTNIESQTAYRNACQYRRRGKLIEERKTDGWYTHKIFKHFNEAKLESRDLQKRGKKVYVLADNNKIWAD